MQEILLIVHILSMALWFGGSVFNGMINMKVVSLGNNEGNATLAKAQKNTGMTFYMPMSILTLLSGVGLVLNGDFDWGSPWISFGFLTVIVAAVLGPVKFQPLTDKMIELHEAGDHEGATAAGMQIGNWSMLSTGLLLISIVLMVIKP